MGRQFCNKDKSCDIVFSVRLQLSSQTAGGGRALKATANCRKVEEKPEERNDSGRSYRRKCAFILLQGTFKQ